MQAGKKFDEWLAENVLEWKREGDRWLSSDSSDEVTLKPFSTDVNAAWEIVDRICESGYRLQLDGSRIWQARFYKSMSHTLETRAFLATGKTPALAICVAAISVKGIEPPR